MKFSEHFKLDKEQPELDFIDIALNKDTLLFIDPFAISLREDKWSQECHHLIVDFFQKIVDAIRDLLQLLEFRANDEDHKIDAFLDASYRSVVM
jgi:hypothetical protein